MMIFINVAKDFTRFPSGRYKEHGGTSGEEFRTRFLENPLSRGEKITIEFDGTLGYGSSFLEEAFGGIVRSLRTPADVLLNLLTFKSTDQTICDEVVQYIIDASLKLK